MKTSQMLKIGMREFRSHLPQYLLTANPVAITRHGETLGYYIPTRHNVKKSDLDDLKEAGHKLEELLIKHGITEDELLSDFRELRKKGRNK